MLVKPRSLRLKISCSRVLWRRPEGYPSSIRLEAKGWPPVRLYERGQRRSPRIMITFDAW